MTDGLITLDVIVQNWVRIDAVGGGGVHIARAIETGMTLFPEEPARTELILPFSEVVREMKTYGLPSYQRCIRTSALQQRLHGFLREHVPKNSPT